MRSLQVCAHVHVYLHYSTVQYITKLVMLCLYIYVHYYMYIVHTKLTVLYIYIQVTLSSIFSKGNSPIHI